MNGVHNGSQNSSQCEWGIIFHIDATKTQQHCSTSTDLDERVDSENGKVRLRLGVIHQIQVDELL